MNRVNVFAIHRCINEGYGLIRIFTEKIRISPTKLWRVCGRDMLSGNNRHVTVLISTNKADASNMMDKFLQLSVL